MLAAIKLPPGLYNNGTEMQSAGHWLASNLMRFHEGRIGPIAGWRKRLSTQTALSGVCRGILTWKEAGSNRWIALGTTTHLYIMNAGGTVTDISPVDLAAGLTDAAVKRGYGMGLYGAARYGVPRPDTGSTTPATTWSEFSWGEYLLAMSDADGRLLEWTLNPATKAAVVTNAPVDQDGFVVMAELFVMTGQGRTMSWCDQEDNTTWTPATTNQAGDFDLPTDGAFQQGLKLASGALVLTTTDAWQVSYVDPTNVFRFTRVGEGCGAISRKAGASTDRMAVWMGTDGFYGFDGYVQPIPCDVSDDVFSNMNTAQASKVTAMHNSAYSEVWWCYPSADSTENNRVAVWNYRENHWVTHDIARTAGADKGVYTNPIMVSSDGYVYEHGVGVDRDGVLPYLESGPLKPGESLPGSAGYMVQVQRVLPDEDVSGDYSYTFYTKTLPNSPSEATQGPYAAVDGEADVLFQAGQMRLRITATADTAGDLGPPRLDIIRGDSLL